MSASAAIRHGYLHRCRERGQHHGCLDHDLHLLDRQPAGLLAQRPDKAQIVQRGRAEVVDHAADLVNRGLRLALDLAEQRRRRRRIALHKQAGRVHRERLARQSRTEPVVEFAAQPPALLLTRRHQLLARAAERDGQLRGVDGGPRLLDKLQQDPAVGGAQLRLTRPWRHAQPAHFLAVGDERELRQCTVGRRADGRRDLLVVTGPKSDL